MEDLKEAKGVDEDSELSAEDLMQLCEAYKVGPTSPPAPTPHTQTFKRTVLLLRAQPAAPLRGPSRPPPISLSLSPPHRMRVIVECARVALGRACTRQRARSSRKTPRSSSSWPSMRSVRGPGRAPGRVGALGRVENDYLFLRARRVRNLCESGR